MASLASEQVSKIGPRREIKLRVVGGSTLRRSSSRLRCATSPSERSFLSSDDQSTAFDPLDMNSPLPPDSVDGDYVEFEGLVLPPVEMRGGGGTRATDADYVRSARANARMLAERCGLTTESRVLDVGCGHGRLLIGILAEQGAVGRYLGLDVRPRVIDWARAHLVDVGRAQRDVNFQRVDAGNERYNRAGAVDVGLPIPSLAYDIIVLISVFTHMRLADTRLYLREAKRVLAPDGRIFCTAFVEDGVPDEEENPSDYLGGGWSGPLHCVRFNRDAFDHAVLAAGLERLRGPDRAARSGQSRFVLANRADG